MKKIYIGFLTLCLCFPGFGLAEEGSKIRLIVESDSPQTNQHAQADTEAKTPLPDPPVKPSPLPPKTQFTQEQIQKFLSKQKKENYIVLNFDNADLKDVINTISSITKENFIVSPGLDARITIHSAVKIPSSEALSVFESILEVNNMALVRSGYFYKIVPGSVVKQKPTEVRKGKEASDVVSEDRPITQIVPVDFIPVGEITPLLQPMLSQFGSLIPNPRNNLLIINDMASSIKRILTVLEEIDIDAFQNTRMLFYQPQYSDVKTISDELAAIVNALDLSRDGSVVIVPLERINSLIIFCSSSSLLNTVSTWLKKLDDEVATGQNIFVYPVQNVEAESIADILKMIFETDGTGTTATQVRRTPTAQRQKKTQRTRVTPQTAGGGSRIEIATFEPTNSLVILAPPGIYRDMVATIQRLDVYPQEVLIEAVIAEVTLTDADQFGVKWSALHSVHIAGDPDFTGLFRGTSDVGPSLLPVIPELVSGPTAGLSYFLFKPERLAVLVHALASRGKVNILSSPRLLVRDQEEASIEVGSEVPTATSTTTATTTETLTQNIEYRTVGIKLKIKPTINDEKTVVLDLEQEVSAKGEDQQVGQEGNLFPSFSTTKTKTSIVIPDKQGIVIGGIMEETTSKSYQGIPILSSIPILGYLFRYTAVSTTKTELIIIITPHVIINKTEAEVLTLEFIDKLKEVKEFLKKNDYQFDIPSGKDSESTPSQ
ncbi:MAG: type II secretion system secretin GspD [Thermodesulfovibrionia bacterium]|nr:type II secretion system secretin GspD [Thermodesulfovibrionia bacterium]